MKFVILPSFLFLVGRVVAENLILTEENFANTISEGFTFVKFFAPWCPHCTDMAPDWNKLAISMKMDQQTNGLLKVGEVDCTTNSVVCIDANVASYPTIKLFKDGKLDSDYGFRREFTRMNEFLLSKLNLVELPNSVGLYTLNANNWKKFLNDQAVVIVKFCSSMNSACEELNPIYQELALVYDMEEDEDVVFAEVDCHEAGNGELCEDENVTDMPSIMIYKQGDVEDVFTDERTVEKLKNFVWETVDPTRVEDAFDDVDMFEALANLQSKSPQEQEVVEESQDDNDEDDDEEDNEDNDGEDEEFDIFEEDAIVKVLNELIAGEEDGDTKQVLQKKLDEVLAQTPEEVLGPAYNILKEQVKKDQKNKEEEEAIPTENLKQEEEGAATKENTEEEDSTKSQTENTKQTPKKEEL